MGFESIPSIHGFRHILYIYSKAFLSVTELGRQWKMYRISYSATILYFISCAKLGSAQPGSGQIRLDLKWIE